VGLERPKLPENFETLDAEGKKCAKAFFLRQSLCALYNTIVYRNNPRLYAALEFQHTLSYTLLLLPRNIVIDGEASYLSQVAALKEEWDTIPGAKGSPYPCSFTPEELQEMETHTEGALLGMQAMEGIRESLEELFPEQGCVRSELYEDAIDALGQMKEQVIDEFAKNQEERQIWEKWWPFGK